MVQKLEKEIFMVTDECALICDVNKTSEKNYQRNEFFLSSTNLFQYFIILR